MRHNLFGHVLPVIALLLVAAPAMVTGDEWGPGSDRSVEASRPEPCTVVKDGDWTVTGMETFKDDSVVLEGNLTVKGTLVLDNTVLSIGSSETDIKWVKVEGGGRLRVLNGSTLMGVSHGRYHFSALPLSSVHINDSEVMDCGTGSDASEERGLYSKATDLMVDNSTITLGGIGILIDGGSGTVAGSSIALMDEGGIVLMNGADLYLSGSNITHCGDVGLAMTSSSANVTGSVVRDSERAIVSASSTLVMDRSRFSSRNLQAFVSSSSWTFLNDCAGSFPGSDQLVLDPPVSGPSRAFLLNTTLSQLAVLDPGGRITESCRKDVLVLTNDGQRADEAEVEVLDAGLHLEFHGITPPSGELLDIPIVSHLTNTTGRWSMDPHQLWVRLEGARRTKHFDSTTSHAFNITVILTDPEVIIDSPVNGSYISSRDVVVKGRVEDERPVSTLSYILDGGSEQILPAQGSFSIPLSTTEGHHEILVIAMNDDGRFGTARSAFTVDTTVPVIDLLNPKNNSLVNTTTVLFAGSCEPEVRLTIDDELAAHPQLTFRHYVHLREGLNSVKIEAFDLAGNGLTRVVHITSDTTLPFIAIMEPLDGHLTKEPSVTIKGTTSQDTMELTADGTKASVSDGTFEVSVKGLEEGENIILLKAIDRVGWTTVKELRVLVDRTPPSLVLRSFPSVTNERDVTLSGMVDEISTVTVNGVRVDVDRGSWSAVVELYQGNNRVLVRATDSAGNFAERSIQIVLDIEPPVIERVQPPSGSVLKGRMLEITGEAFDENGLASISGRKVGGSFQELNGLESWSWFVELASGPNGLEVRAEDLAGNVRTMPLQYTVEATDVPDRTAPVVTIIDPRMNASLGSGTIWVKGTATDNVGIASVHVRVDGGEWKEVEGLFRWSLNITLGTGHHIIEAMALDASGNKGMDTVKVLVTIPSDGGTSAEGGGPRPWMYAVLVILIVIFSLMAIYLVLRRNALKRQIEEEALEREQRGAGKRPRTTPRAIGGPGPRATTRAGGRAPVRTGTDRGTPPPRSRRPPQR